MSTNDVFATAVTAMSSFGDVPLGGEVHGIDITNLGYVTINIDERSQSAQALLAWVCSLKSSRVIHHHANGKVFVSVGGTREGSRWDVWSTFVGDDAAVLCEHENDGGPMSVHRLRLVQMRQIAALAGVR